MVRSKNLLPERQCPLNEQKICPMDFTEFIQNLESRNGHDVARMDRAKVVHIDGRHEPKHHTVVTRNKSNLEQNKDPVCSYCFDIYIG